MTRRGLGWALLPALGAPIPAGAPVGCSGTRPVRSRATEASAGRAVAALGCAWVLRENGGSGPGDDAATAVAGSVR